MFLHYVDDDEFLLDWDEDVVDDLNDLRFYDGMEDNDHIEDRWLEMSYWRYEK